MAGCCGEGPGAAVRVGLEIVTSANPWLGRAPTYPEIREVALAGEAAGFDSLWVYDHLLYRDGDRPAEGIWEGWTMLSALAEATATVGLGSLVSCAAFRNPALLAKMAVTLDEVSGGRFTLGLGAGWNDAEFAAFGLPLDHRVSRFEEAAEVIGPLLREGAVSYEGRFHRADRCEIVPRGPRPTGPPLLMAGFGPRMMGLVARHADLWNGGYAATPDDLVDLRARLDDACRAIGRDPATLGITAELKVCFPDLAPPPMRFEGRFATGSPAEVAASMQAFDAAGCAEIMVTCWPSTVEAVGRLEVALAHFRAGPGA